MVHTSEPYQFGIIVKRARENSRMTVEELAEKLDLTDRYIYKIESGEKLPSFKVLYQLVRTLSINPDSIFYPETPSKELGIEDLVRMLQSCDKEYMVCQMLFLSNMNLNVLIYSIVKNIYCLINNIMVYPPKNVNKF